MMQMARLTSTASRVHEEDGPRQLPLWAQPAHRIAGRAISLAGQVTVRTTGVAVTFVVNRVRHGKEAAWLRAAEQIVAAVESLGPTYVKFGQMAASRADLFSPAILSVLSSFHDRVSPMSPDERASQWGRACRDNPNLRDVDLTEELLGSGSIACVYRGSVAGRAVAVKLQRPHIAERMSLDLALLVRSAALVERVQRQSGARIADLVRFMSDALFDQVNFEREAGHAIALRANLTGHPRIVVPEIYPHLSGKVAIVMELIDDLGGGRQPALSRAALDNCSRVALAAVGTMIFENGFVHCDLHPGNLYVLADGTIVILDCGYTVAVPGPIREHLAAFFTALNTGDGRRCGQIMFDSALNDGHAHDRERFIERVSALVHESTRGRFEMSDFGQSVAKIQADHGVHPPSAFAFPLMSMLVVEGTLRQMSADTQMSAAHAGPPGVYSRSE